MLAQSLGTISLITVSLLISSTPCAAENLYKEIDRLIENKKNNHSFYGPPIKSTTQPLNLTLGFEIRAIREFSEASEKFSVIGSIYMEWRDDRMIWNPQDYGGVKNFVTRNDIFWTPSIFLINAFEEYKKIGDDEYWPIRFLANGDALYYPGNVFTAVCVPNLIHYPWDKQECPLEFQVYGHLPQEIQLVPLVDHVYTRGYSEHGTWELLGSRVFLKEDNITMSFSLKLKRKPDFLVLNVLLPIIFMGYLNTLVFLMPTNSGERISYSLTVLLAIAVFLTIIGYNLPNTARSIPYISYYLMTVLLISIVIIVMLTFSLRIFYRRADTDIPAFWACIGRFFRCKSSQTWHAQSLRYERGHADTSSGFELSETENGTAESTINRSTPSADEATTRDGVKWIDISKSLDWIFFLTSFLALSLCTILFLAFAVNN